MAAPPSVTLRFPESDHTLPTPDVLAERKAALRVELATRRAELADEQGEAAAVAVADRLTREVRLPEAAVVAGYWPLAHELDPRPAMRRLSAAGHRLALPRMQGPRAPLAFHAFAWPDPLFLGRFGVREPDAAAAICRPTVVLVPLLGFDRQGHRLGYGKGYYDRTLRALRAEGSGCLAVGLAFAAQEVAELPATASDEPLDLVITERASHRFTRRGGAASE